MANSDIIKIGFDYRASLAQFEKETNGVFDGISNKAGKQKIIIQLDAKDDKVIDKIKELQKLKLDKFTFEFGNSGLKEQLQTFDKLENKINEIIGLSKGIDLSFNTKNKTDAYNQLKKYADAFKDYYGNEEAMATNAGAKAGYAYYKAYEEALRKGVAQSKLEKVTIDFDVNDSFFSKERIVGNRIKEFENFQKYGNADESNLIAEITSLENRLLKFNSAYSQVKANLGDAPITPEITKNIEEYVRLLEVAESRAKDAELFGYSSEDINSDKDLANMYLDFAKEDATAKNKKYIESLKQEETQTIATAEAEQKLAVAQKETVSNTSNSNNSQIEELKSDIQEVKTELGDVKDRISSIESNGFENVRDDVEKTKESVKELNSEFAEMKSNLSSTSQESNISSGRKDAFPDKDVSASVESATNSIKEENNVLEQNTQKVKENADAKKKLTDTDKEVSNVNLSKYDNRLESYTKKTSGYDATITRFENGGWTSDTYKQRVNAVKEAVAEYERILSSLKNNPDLVTEENLNKLNKQEKLIKDNITAVQNMSAAEKGYSLISAQKELDKINNILKEHSGMSREAKNQMKAYYAEIKSGNPSASLDVIHGKIMQIVNAEIEAGRGGKSMFDAIKEKAWYGVASAIGTYFGFNDFIRYGKEGVSIVRQLDTALTEMRKVSNESVQSLKKYQDTTFDTADAVGTTAKQIQNSTADWMRLGESMDTAAKSAKDANILLDVSEFEGIDEATESLVSMSQAYKDLDKMDIIDVLNNIGNNYSISTDGLATALKDSASALVTANNDLNEAVSLTTAGNAITQDPSKVGAGLRTISLRLVGTEEAKEELSDLGEETDGMITTVSKLRNTIQSATSAATKDGKGFDIFDSNGNYKSTYEIMQGLADLYDEIVKKDKELGTNNLNLLLETIAGKNRSNIAASILQNGDMLRSVYEDAQNSEGSAEKELNSYLDSVDGKFQQLQNRTQEFWYNVIDTTTVKSVLDFTTDLTEGASKFFKLVEKHLPTILGAIATIIASNKSGGLIRLINFINNSPFLATVEFNREVCELIV
jgi:TP901 family phage tail tape measure protein